MTLAIPFAIMGGLFVLFAITGALDHFSTADRSASDSLGGEYTRTPLRDVIGLAACAVASFAIAALIMWMTP